MKKGYFQIVMFLLSIILLTGCNSPGSTLETQTASGQSVPNTATGKSDAMHIIDPLEIMEDLGKNVQDATAGTEFMVDYQIIPKPDSYKYKYMHEAFEFMGESEYAYYSFYTPLDAPLIQSTEYEVYFDVEKTDIFIKKFNEMYNALCGEYGADNIYRIGNTELDAPAESLNSLTLESMIECFKAYQDGTYYISWQGPDYLVHLQIILDGKNRDGAAGNPFYEVMLAFDKSGQIQEMKEISPGAFELDSNAVFMSIDPLAFTWLNALGTDIDNFIEGRTEGTDYEKTEMPEADGNYPLGAYTAYIFHPFGISFMGQQDPLVIMVVPEGSGIYSISYAASFSKNNNLDPLIANIKAEYNNVCTLYGQPTEISLTLPDGQEESTDFSTMLAALSDNQVGMYSCYWVDTPDGNVYLGIMNPSEQEEINGRLTFSK